MARGYFLPLAMSDTPAVAGPPVLKLFGGAVIQSGNTPLGGPAAHRHRLALLAILAVSGRPMSRDKLVAYLWPERETEPARNLLKTALHEIRKVLGERTIVSTGDLLSLDTTQLPCDVVDFENAVRAGDLQAARELYTGPFLDGFFIRESNEFEEWAFAERTRLERLHEKVIETIGDAPLPTPHVPLPTPHGPLPTPHTRLPTLWAIALAALVIIVAASGGVVWKKAADRDAQPAAILQPNDVDPGTALEFNGNNSIAATPAGTLVTTQVDDIAVDLWARYAGPSSKPVQTLYYNGNGAYSGWGLLVVGAPDGQPDGTIALLAGGIIIKATPLVLKKGTWQHVAAERRGGSVTVTLDDSSYVAGDFPVTPIGAKFKDSEHTTVGSIGPLDGPGNPFNGSIDRLRIRNLAAGYWYDRWYFDEGKGSSTSGYKGDAFELRNVQWVPSAPLAPRDVFWGRLESLCGQAYTGSVGIAGPVDSAVTRAPVNIYVYKCAPTEIRIGLYVGADRSRVMVIDRVPGGLRITRELTRENGSPAAGSGVTGLTRDAGAPGAQTFVSASGEEWHFEIDPAKTLVFGHSERAADLLRIAFDLEKQIASPPPPWGR
jgi:hypothetical protein